MMKFHSVLLDQSVADRPITSLIQQNINADTIRWITPQEATDRLAGTVEASTMLPNAKQTLLVTQNPGSFYKGMDSDPGISDCQRSMAMRLELFQGCPLDCVYCFCQQYLSCHHTVVFANIEESTRNSRIHLNSPDIALVTGDIADSLALGKLSVIIHEYVGQLLPDARFELRSKFQLPENFNLLDPDRFRLDWSLSPESAWRLNEKGTASPSLRIDSIRQAVEHGYSVGVRLDPIQYRRDEYEGDCWSDYEPLLESLHQSLEGNYPERFLVGSFKVSEPLKRLIRKRFPDNPIPGLEWVHCPDGKLRPFRSHRLRSYRQVLEIINRYFPGIPTSLSMELSFILNLL